MATNFSAAIILTVTINHGENLAIRDVLSSDPYIEVYVGAKKVGRTQTIKQNHLKPIWNEIIEIPLQHVHSTLTLKILDEDSNKSDFMGIIEYDLSTLDYNEQLTLVQPVMAHTKSQELGEGMLSFNLLLKRAENVVKITPKDFSVEFTPEVSAMVCEELQSLQISDAINRALLQSPLLFPHRYGRNPLLRRSLVNDMLMDVLALSRVEEAPVTTIDESDRLFRTDANLSWSTSTMNLSSFECESTAPFTDTNFAVRFVFAADSTQPRNVKLSFPNKLMMWNWVKWLRTLCRVFRENIDIPVWASASEGKYVSSVPLDLQFIDRTYTGKITLSLQPFMLICEGTKATSKIINLPLEELESVNISVDSVTPQQVCLKVCTMPLVVSSGGCRPTGSKSIIFANGSIGVVETLISESAPKPKFLVVDIDDDLISSNFTPTDTTTTTNPNEQSKNDQSGGIKWRGFHVLFNDCSTTANTVLAHRFVDLSELKSINLPNEAKSLLDSFENCSKSFVEEVELWGPSSVSINLVSASNINSKEAKKGAENLAVKCELVDCVGRVLSDDKTQNLWSPPVHASANPIFQDFSFLLQVNSTFVRAQYVKLNIISCTSHNASSGNEKGGVIGSVFIPCSDIFGLQSKGRNISATYPVNQGFDNDFSLLRRNNSSVGAKSGATFSVRLCHQQFPAAQPAIKVQLKFKLFLTSTVNSYALGHPGLSVLGDGAVNANESVVVSTHYSGLVIRPILNERRGGDRLRSNKVAGGSDTREGVAGHGADDENSDAATGHNFLARCCGCLSPRGNRKNNTYSRVELVNSSNIDGQQTDPDIAHRCRQNEINGISILHLCRERLSFEDEVFVIPWANVTSVDVITPSIASVQLCIHRFTVAGQKKFYVEDQVQIFVMNCVATEFCEIVKDKVDFFQVRDRVKQAQASKLLPGGVDFDVPFELDSNGAPIPMEQSFASQVMTELDGEIVEFESNSRKLETDIEAELVQEECEVGKGNPRSCGLMIKKAKVDCKLSRLQLYMTALLTAAIGGIHSFNDSVAELLADRDFERMQKITMKTEVVTVKTKLEFLLNMAERHLKVAALCGWNFEERTLETFLESIVNNYLIAMVNLMGKFFERGTTVTKEMKGLESFTTLIFTFMKHNDRLAQLLDSVLRPYYLVANKSPTLSLFLNIDTVISWYAAVLDQEMCECVNRALKSEAKETDPSKPNPNYHSSLPWIPSRLRGTEGVFITSIPATLNLSLNEYKKGARLKQSDIAPSFRAIAHKMDEKIRIAYFHAFKHLSDCVWRHLARDWTDKATGEVPDLANTEMVEHLEWLCSVANDCNRIVQSDMMRISLSDDTKEMSEQLDQDCWNGEVNCEGLSGSRQAEGTLLDQINSSLSAAMLRALDHISCIVFRFLASNTLWLEREAYKKWLPSPVSDTQSAASEPLAENESRSTQQPPLPHPPPSSSTAALSSPFADQLPELEFILTTKFQLLDYLDPSCYFKLISLCADKIIVRYLFLLKEAQATGKRVFKLNGPEIDQITKDVAAIKQTFLNLMNGPPAVSSASDSIQNQFRYLDHMIVLIGSADVGTGGGTGDEEAGRANEKVQKTLQSIVKYGEGHPQNSYELAEFVRCCMCLRADFVEFSGQLDPKGTRLKRLGFGGFGLKHKNSFTQQHPYMIVIEKLEGCRETPDHPVELIYRDVITKTFQTYSYRICPLRLLLLASSVPDIDSMEATAPTALDTLISGRFSVLNHGGRKSVVTVSGLRVAHDDHNAQISLQISLAGIILNTSTVKCDAQTKDFVWPDEVFEFPIVGIALNLHLLNCSLFVKKNWFGMLSSKKLVANVRIPLSTLDIENFENITVKLTNPTTSTVLSKNYAPESLLTITATEEASEECNTSTLTITIRLKS